MDLRRKISLCVVMLWGTHVYINTILSMDPHIWNFDPRMLSGVAMDTQVWYSYCLHIQLEQRTWRSHQRPRDKSPLIPTTNVHSLISVPYAYISGIYHHQVLLRWLPGNRRIIACLETPSFLCKSYLCDSSIPWVTLEITCLSMLFSWFAGVSFGLSIKYMIIITIILIGIWIM